jgi:TolB-like protein/thioredoxin-like negative regulator of GroEL
MALLQELKRRHVIRVALAYLAGAWLLIQVLETIFPIFGIPETSIRIVVIVLAIGLLPALVLAWVFQWTPQGLQRDRDAATEAGANRGSTRTLDRIIIITLTVAVFYFAVDKYVVAPDNLTNDVIPAAEIAKRYSAKYPVNDISIAVLPFDNMSDDPEQQYFADGLSEEMLNSLVPIRGLRVISRTSSFAFRDRDLSVAELASILGVGHLLEGSVRRAGNSLRVTVQLIDAVRDRHLWSETFDRTLTVDTVLSLQTEIAETVANALQLELSPGNARALGSNGPANMKALDQYLDGLYYMNRLDPISDPVDENRDKAIQKLRAAIEFDAHWAPPRVALAVVYHFTKELGNSAENMLTAKGLIADAIRIDPEYSEAHVALAYHLAVEGRYDESMAEYNLAEALGDNVHWGRAVLMRVLAQHDDAIDEFHAAIASEPLSATVKVHLFETYYCGGRYVDSIDGFTEFFSDLVYEVREPSTIILMANAYARSGDVKTAMTLANGFAEMHNDEAPVASVFALAGQPERARRALESSSDTSPWVMLDIAPAAILLGDRERAIDMLEQAAAAVLDNNVDRYNWLWKFRCSAEVRSLAGNPRFDALLRRLGLPSQ